MKTKLITTIMIMLFLASMLSMAFVAPVAATPDSGIVGLWHFDEGIGSTAYDSSGFDNDGTLSGGKFGNALKFDGINDYVEVPSSSSLAITDATTIEVWVYASSALTNMRIECKPYSTEAWVPSYADYELVVLSEAGWSGHPGRAVYFGLTLGGAWTFLATSAPYVVPLNTWTHLAATYDGTYMKIYINGLERASRSASGTIRTSGNPLFIGTRTPVPNEVFNGIIDEVRISNIARTSFDLTAPPSVDANTVALWHFDESVDLTVYDEADTPDADDGTIYGAKWVGPTWVDGKFKKALSFDGIDDYVMVPDSGSIAPPSVTVEAWVKRSGTPGTYKYIISKYYVLKAGSWSSYAFYTGSTGGLYFYVGDATSYRLSPNAGTGIWDGNWHHIAGTFDDVSNTLKLYVDGSLVPGLTSGTGESIGYDSGDLFIGTYRFPDGRWCFSGTIDEVCIWNRALSDVEIGWSKEGVPFFIVSASPSSQTVGQGQAASYDVGVDRDGIAVSLSVSGLPSGASATFTPSSGTPDFDSTLFVTTTTATPSGTYTLTITGTGGGVTKSTTVTLIVAPIQKQSFMTDSQFIQIGSFDTVFTPDKATSSLKLTATNPGTYYYNKIIKNTGTDPLTVTITVTIPSVILPTTPSKTLEQVFLLKGSNPIHVFSDLARTIDVTGTASITPAQPLSTQLTSVSDFTIAVTIPAGELRYITAHLDFAGKGIAGFASTAPTAYFQGFKFTESITMAEISGTIEDVTTFTGVGKRVTAIGGFALDTNLDPKSALKVKVLKASEEVGSSGITPSDGFYFVSVPAGGPYTVQLYNPSTATVLKSTSVASVAVDEFVQVDFLNLNPADPAIEGFVFDASTKGVAGVTVQLYDGRGKLMASTKTSASGWYAFRFSAPGTYTVKIIVPSGYKADKTSVTVSIKQFETLRVDFNLK